MTSDYVPPDNVVHQFTDAQLAPEPVGLGQAVAEGFSGSVGGSLRLLSQWYAPEGQTPLSEDQFNQGSWKDTGIDYKPGMTREEANLLADAHNDAQMHSYVRSRISGAGTAGYMAGSLAGGLIDPINLLPLGAAFNVGSGIVKGAVAGGLTNAALSLAVYSPLQQAVANRYQFDYGPKDWATSAVEQAAIGAVVGALPGSVGWLKDQVRGSFTKNAAEAIGRDPQALVEATAALHDPSSASHELNTRVPDEPPPMTHEQLVKKFQDDFKVDQAKAESLATDHELANREQAQQLQDQLSSKDANAETVRRLQNQLDESSGTIPNKEVIDEAIKNEATALKQTNDNNAAFDAVHKIDQIKSATDAATVLKDAGLEGVKDTSIGQAAQLEIDKLQVKKSAWVDAFACLLGG